MIPPMCLHISTLHPCSRRKIKIKHFNSVSSATEKSLSSIGISRINVSSACKQEGKDSAPFPLDMPFMILYNQGSNCPCSNYDLFSKTTLFHYLASSYHHTPCAHHLICPCSWYNWMIYHVLTFFPRNII